MITLDNIMDLCNHYKIYGYTDENIQKVLTFANEAIEEILDPFMGQPPFFYYTVLEHIHERHLKFIDLPAKEQRRYCDDTIAEIQRVWNLDITHKMMDFLKNTWEMNMAYCYRWFSENTVRYEANEDHINNFKALAELLGYRYEIKEPQNSNQSYQIIIFFN